MRSANSGPILTNPQLNLIEASEKYMKRHNSLQKLLPVLGMSLFVSLPVLVGGCNDKGNKVIDSSKADLPPQTEAELQAEANAERANSGLIN